MSAWCINYLKAILAIFLIGVHSHSGFSREKSFPEKQIIPGENALNSCNHSNSTYDRQILKVLTFNILAGGKPATEIGSTSPLFIKPRFFDIAGVILKSGADIVCVNEPPETPDPLLPLLQKNDPDWQVRGGSDGRININLYSRFPIEPDPLHPDDPTIHSVIISPEQSVIVCTIHWWPERGMGSGYIQKRIMEGSKCYRCSSGGRKSTKSRTFGEIRTNSRNSVYRILALLPQGCACCFQTTPERKDPINEKTFKFIRDIILKFRSF